MPIDLFTAPIEKTIREDLKPVWETLQREARGCQMLILWLDCDREGEAICFEVFTYFAQIICLFVPRSANAVKK